MWCVVGVNVAIVNPCQLVKRVFAAVNWTKLLRKCGRVAVKCPALLITKVFIVCAWMFGCSRRPTSTIVSSMVQSKGRVFMSKWLMHCVFSCVFHLIFCRQYRFMAYRQLTAWCWGWLGKNIRVVLPSCAVNKIRSSFPSVAYAGFKYPQL